MILWLRKELVVSLNLWGTIWSFTHAKLQKNGQQNCINNQEINIILRKKNGGNGQNP